MAEDNSNNNNKNGAATPNKESQPDAAKPTHQEKTPEQQQAEQQEALKKQQQEATEQLEAMLKSNNPKNLGQGLTRGAGNILGGALGACGIVVLAPTAGLAVGTKEGGILGGIVGLTGGAIVGVLGGAVVAVAGVASGVGQIVRGVISIPNSIIQPRKGNWWDENEGRWVETNLTKEKEGLKGIPDDNSDILGKLMDVPDKKDVPDGFVKETDYYDYLEVDPKADAGTIKKKYYLLARKYHPDKVGKDNVEAAEKFKNVAEAYQVLSDPNLRKVYDTQGKEGLSGDKTSVAVTGANLDPTLLYAFLFGSDKFNEYVGTLGVAASAAIGDTKKVSWKDSRTLQKRRCAKLALLLAQRIETFVIDGKEEEAKAEWKKEAQELVKASYGYELLRLVGQVYSLSGAQFLGSLDSGVGMPSIANWANSNMAKLKAHNETNKQKKATMFAGLTMMQMQMKHAQELQKATSEEDKQKINEAFQKEATETMLKIMWTTTAVDITNTLFEVCQMVFFDKSVEKDVRKKRGRAVKALGDVFMSIPPPPAAASSVEGDGATTPVDAEEVYRVAAEAAMLETVKRKEEAAFRNSFTPVKSFRMPSRKNAST